ncbi:MAG: hypothetical protein IBX58_18065 [Roseovarius sp.]|nr:hypothetical protein [Roseovarius sp.]
MYSPIKNDPWRFEITPWVWMISSRGDVGVLGRKADADASFGDVVRDSDSLLALAGRVEVGYDRIAAFFDGMYAKIGFDNKTIQPQPFPRIDARFEMAIYDFGLSYRIAQWTSTSDYLGEGILHL